MASDTGPAAQAQFDALLRQMTPAEKVQRMSALSDAVRATVWAGAERVAAHKGRAAVIQRFFLQMHGPSVPVPGEILARFTSTDEQ